MDLSVKLLILISIFFSLVSTILLVAKDKINKKDLFDAVRATNQVSLLHIEEKIVNGEEIKDECMLEEWITEFLIYNKVDFESVDIEFLCLNNDPPVYVVSIDGYNKYQYISKDLYSKFTSSATIVDN